MQRLQDRVIVITGAAKGQGAAEAELCAAEGAEVVVADVLEPAGREVADRIGGRFHRLDVSSADDWQALAEGFDRIDGLVNNAGVFRALSMQQTDEDTYRRIFEINQLGVFLGMQAVAPVMERSGGGSIVNISSIGGMRGDAGFRLCGHEMGRSRDDQDGGSRAGPRRYPGQLRVPRSDRHGYAGRNAAGAIG
jgi:3alpha(or 20beta)-hydroxysteroid dehydrogenase